MEADGVFDDILENFTQRLAVANPVSDSTAISDLQRETSKLDDHLSNAIEKAEQYRLCLNMPSMDSERKAVGEAAVFNSEDLLSVIFKFLDFGALLGCATVCKLWRRVASHDTLWNSPFQRRWPEQYKRLEAARLLATSSAPSTPWCSEYFGEVCLARNWETGNCPSQQILWEGSRSLFCAVSFDRDTLLTSGFTPDINVIDAHSGETHSRFVGHSGPVECLAVRDNIVASGSRDGTVRLWDMHKPLDDSGLFPCRLQVQEYHDPSQRVLCLCMDGRYIASGGSSRAVQLRDYETGQEVSRVDHLDSISGVKICGNLLYSASMDTTVAVTDLRSNTKVEDIQFGWPVLCLDVASGHIDEDDSEHVLVTGVADHNVYVLRNSQHKVALEGHSRPVSTVAFARDNHLIVSGGADKSVNVWSALSAMGHAPRTYPLYRLGGHKDYVSCLVTTGDTIHSGSLDNTLRSWSFLPTKTYPTPLL